MNMVGENQNGYEENVQHRIVALQNAERFLEPDRVGGRSKQ